VVPRIFRFMANASASEITSPMGIPIIMNSVFHSDFRKYRSPNIFV
jgi:hypothetical protein